MSTANIDPHADPSQQYKKISFLTDEMRFKSKKIMKVLSENNK
jgi:hypothetical protein